MATSGSFNTGSVGNFYFTFEWSRTGYDSTKNEHYISYTLKAHNTAGKYRTVYAKKLVINGTTVFEEAGTSGNGKSYYDGNVVTSGSRTIKSSNDAGDGSLNVSFEAGVGQYPSTNCSGSGSWSLDRIPRNFSGWSVSQKSNALNEVTIQWTTNEERDWTGWSFQMGIPDTDKSYTGSATYSESVASNGKSGTFVIRNLDPGISTTVTIAMRRKDSQLWSYKNITISTKAKATISSPSDNFSVNSDGTLKVDCSNPSGNDIAYFLDCPSGTRRLTTGKTKNTSYTWSNEQILSMLQYFPNENSKSIKVGVITYGNTEYYSEKVGTLNVVNSNPTFNNFTYEDIKSKTIALTGNNQIIIKGYSDVRTTVSTANKAVAKNYATMSKYRLVIGSSQVDVNYSANANVQATINSVKNNIFTMYAIDSRGNSTPKQISPLGYIDYSPITINKAEAVRADGIGSEVTLIFNGSIWEGSFGAVLNEIVSCSYKYKETTSNTWINGTTVLNPVRSGKTFAFTGLIKGDLGANGFNINKSDNIQVIITDKLSTATYDYVLGSGKPGIAITKNGVAINGMYDENLQGGLQVNGDLYVNGVKIN